MPILRHFDTVEMVSVELAQAICDASRTAVTNKGTFKIAFSGGSLPKLACSELVKEPFRSKIEWSKWHVFFVDERCVKLSHADSNYRLVEEYLLKHVDITESNVHTYDERLEPDVAAQAYEAEIRNVFKLGADEFPVFDLVLLGMGEDGHTASLFPNHPLLNETKKIIASIEDSPKPPPARITFTFPTINAAREVYVVATGQGKADLVKKVFTDPSDVADKLPVQRATGTTQALWYVDAAAVSKLDHPARYM